MKALRLALLVAALLASGSTAHAASLLGTWVIDKEAWRAGIGEVVRAAEAAVPAGEHERGAEIGSGIREMLESDGIDGEVELLPEGQLRSRWTRRGRTDRDEGTWTMIGSEVELVFIVGDEGDGGDEVRLRGPLDGQRMRLKPVLAAAKRDALASSPALAAAMQALVYPFARADAR